MMLTYDQYRGFLILCCSSVHRTTHSHLLARVYFLWQNITHEKHHTVQMQWKRGDFDKYREYHKGWLRCGHFHSETNYSTNLPLLRLSHFLFIIHRFHRFSNMKSRLVMITNPPNLLKPTFRFWLTLYIISPCLRPWFYCLFQNNKNG